MRRNIIESIRTREISTSTFADIMDSHCIGEVISRSVSSMNTTRHYFIGEAYTVAWERVRKTGDISRPQPSTWSQVKDFLVPQITSAQGRVYVAGGGPLITEAALAGGLSCSYFAKLGFEGVVLGGAVRDASEVKALTMPVLASNFTPVDTQGSYRIKSVGERCVIDGCSIKTGNIVISDANGTVILPPDILDEIFDLALEIEQAEEQILQAIRDQHDKRSLLQLVEERNRI
ncbi:RraA family protein [Pseudomonas chlororaphis]|uniref:RraA family protein n=1 Tax=Pseudomonas chlororaphis TaxID=587753 RepID=UPI0015DD9358|nr:RraA family protein [Pseudomonas chlororaphis]QLL16341.1 RraA family protein [Pseudomonas chlororaphis subsp. aurantiaca]